MHKYLHLLPDNNFLNPFIEIAEKISPGENKYIIHTPTIPFTKALKAQKIAHKNAIIAPYNSSFFPEAVGDVNSYDKIFIHFLSKESIDFINRNASIKAKIIWLFWGSDFYSPYNYFKETLYDTRSLEYFNKHNTFVTQNSLLGNFAKNVKVKYIDPLFEQKIIEEKAKAIKRIDAIGHWTKLDYDLIIKYFPTKAKYLPFIYYEHDYSKLEDQHETEHSSQFSKEHDLKNKTVILLGNSASLTNNHFSALDYLVKYKNENIALICPMSYGDNKYRNAVISYGNSLFGNNFIALLHLLPKTEYTALLANVDISMMNHWRTEGAGNTMIMLAKKKKVILNSKSTLFHFLKGEGITLYDINEPDLDMKSKINSIDASRNKEILCNLFPYNKACSFIEGLYQF